MKSLPSQLAAEWAMKKSTPQQMGAAARAYTRTCVGPPLPLSLKPSAARSAFIARSRPSFLFARSTISDSYLVHARHPNSQACESSGNKGSHDHLRFVPEFAREWRRGQEVCSSKSGKQGTRRWVRRPVRKRV